MILLSIVTILSIQVFSFQLPKHHYIIFSRESNFQLHITKNSIRNNNIKNIENVAGQESFSSLLNEIDKHQIQDLYFTNDMKKVIGLKNSDVLENDIAYEDLSVTEISPPITQTIIDSGRKNNIKMFILPSTSNVFETFSQISSVIGGFISSSFSLFLLYSIVMLIFRRNSQNSGMPGNISPFGRSGGNGLFGGIGNEDVTKDKIQMQKENITLSDWAGSPEIFEECNEVVTYLKNDTVYKDAGAKIPRGILLEGPPGTGKTLIAKAIASECDANFISVASSEFVEVFVGLGAQKVRNLFQKARDNTPCVLFIDEIDSIGKQRGTGVNLGNDEREQTLNQLLAEMDGFNSNEGVLILAATNRRDVLDSALLRPGRFDRIINVPLPDKDSRKEIFKVHTSNKRIDPKIQYEFLAELSSGFSGAQIKNLVNEAAILAARNSRKVISQEDLESSLEKMIVGIVKRNDTRSEATRTRVSIHEAGHALLAAIHNEYFDLKKVTIQATYNGAGGYTLFNDKKEISEGGLYTKEALKKRLIVSMGGKAAESIIYGDDFVSLGAVQDLKTANQLAQSMIGNYGMGDELKVFYNENTESGKNPFLGRSLAMGDKYSEKTKEKIDDESLTLVKEAYKDSYKTLSMFKGQLLKVAKLLMDNDTVYNDKVMEIINDEYKTDCLDEEENIE